MSGDTQSDLPKDKTMDATGQSAGTGLDDLPAVDFHGAAVIDENGQEVPITEAMLLTAFERLED